MVTNTVGEHTVSIFKLEKALHYFYAEEAVAFSKRLATIDQNTQFHIPEDSSYYSELQLGEWVYHCFPWSLNANQPLFAVAAPVPFLIFLYLYSHFPSFTRKIPLREYTASPPRR
jgi:hypothetical protein